MTGTSISICSSTLTLTSSSPSPLSSPRPKRPLLGLTLDQLAAFTLESGEPKYRGRQLFTWLYTKGATSFEAMSDLSKTFRHRLEESAEIGRVVEASRQVSRRDGTTKFLFALHDGLHIESVLIPPASSFQGKGVSPEDEQRRLTLCVSTQVGCPLACEFCATGTMGLLRNLKAGEIVSQVLEVQRATRRKMTNVVFMGMGEPLLNYEQVMTAAEILSSGVGIAARRITISTAGRADRIRHMGEERRRFKLAVSLHSAVDPTRSLLMPINKKFGVGALMNAVEAYYRHTKQRVTYEYILLNGINDTDREIERLIALARRVPSKINIIPFHSIRFTSPSGFAATLRPSRRMAETVARLREAGLTVMVRSSAGDDIDAACGQLAVKEARPAAQRVAPDAA
ncbi:MAG: 23S rRNA (adenine(2503)-C(2))-methyltransferase RlmN [Bacteroidota bacterium]